MCPQVHLFRSGNNTFDFFACIVHLSTCAVHPSSKDQYKFQGRRGPQLLQLLVFCGPVACVSILGVRILSGKKREIERKGGNEGRNTIPFQGNHQHHQPPFDGACVSNKAQLFLHTSHKAPRCLLLPFYCSTQTYAPSIANTFKTPTSHRACLFLQDLTLPA